MHEIFGNIHMHTVFSDGRATHRQIWAAAAAAGLDFVVITDHNVWGGGLEGYKETEQGRLLCLIGEEVHHVRRQPPANHCLVIGADRPMAPYASDPQQLIDEIRQAGGYSFLAHPHDQAIPILGESDYAWKNWDVHGFAGLELWNYMSSFKESAMPIWRLIPSVFWPDRWLRPPHPDTLAKWDELLMANRRVSVIGGSDAHGFIRQLGPFKVELFPYEQLFKAINTHLLLDEPLSGEFGADKTAVTRAIGHGRGWVGYDYLAPTTGFRFSAKGQNRGTMGDTVIFQEQATLQVFVPTKARIDLVFEGEIVAQERKSVSLLAEVNKPGAYRVVCYAPYNSRDRGWIYSNPIYLVHGRPV